MFDKPISWGELITLVLFILGSGVLFYLIMALVNLNGILKNVNQLIKNNKSNIDKSIEKLPEITDNAAKITGMVKENLTTIQHVVDDVGKISGTVKKGVETIQKDIILKAKSILDLFDAVKKLFEKKKDASPKKKKGTVYKYKYKLAQEKPDEVEIITNEQQESKPYEAYDTVEPVEGANEDINDYKAAEEV